MFVYTGTEDKRYKSLTNEKALDRVIGKLSERLGGTLLEELQELLSAFANVYDLILLDTVYDIITGEYGLTIDRELFFEAAMATSYRRWHFYNVVSISYMSGLYETADEYLDADISFDDVTAYLAQDYLIDMDSDAFFDMLLLQADKPRKIFDRETLLSINTVIGADHRRFADLSVFDAFFDAVGLDSAKRADEAEELVSECAYSPHEQEDIVIDAIYRDIIPKEKNSYENTALLYHALSLVRNAIPLSMNNGYSPNEIKQMIESGEGSRSWKTGRYHEAPLTQKRYKDYFENCVKTSFDIMEDDDDV